MHLKIHSRIIFPLRVPHVLSESLPCTTVYEASTEDRLVMTVTSSSLLELSMSMLMERSISRWRLVTMPVGYVRLVRRPSLSYLGDDSDCSEISEEGTCSYLYHICVENVRTPNRLSQKGRGG